MKRRNEPEQPPVLKQCDRCGSFLPPYRIAISDAEIFKLVPHNMTLSNKQLDSWDCFYSELADEMGDAENPFVLAVGQRLRVMLGRTPLWVPQRIVAPTLPPPKAMEETALSPPRFSMPEAPLPN
jgi:hypothetical protein